jgi:hypothetical protein
MKFNIQILASAECKITETCTFEFCDVLLLLLFFMYNEIWSSSSTNERFLYIVCERELKMIERWIELWIIWIANFTHNFTLSTTKVLHNPHCLIMSFQLPHHRFQPFAWYYCAMFFIYSTAAVGDDNDDKQTHNKKDCFSNRFFFIFCVFWIFCE